MTEEKANPRFVGESSAVEMSENTLNLKTKYKLT